MKHLTLSLLAGSLALPAIAQDASVGAEIYRIQCATCHGLDADGTGPMAPILLVQPSDLTTMTERHGGTFPMIRVVMRIDGREPLVSHGSDMPIFGEYFEGVQDVPLKAESGQPMLVSQPIADLAAFLQAIQK